MASPQAVLAQWPRFQIVFAKTGDVLASTAAVAWTPLERMVGLLGRSSLPAGEALVFPSCRSIHTFGMQFPIDVAFIDRQWRIVRMFHAVGPCRLLGPVWDAWGAIETASLTMARATAGDQLDVAPAVEQ